jgi:hypothetical protein
MSVENASHKDGHDVDDDVSESSSVSALPEMPLLPITSPETVKACQSLAVTDHDIFVCSYPKSGTTWTQNLVVRLLAAHVGMILPHDWHLSHSAPFYEVNQYWKSSSREGDDPRSASVMERVPVKTPLQGPADDRSQTYRVFNTHLRPHQLPRNAKCVYVMRDPMDVMLSFYHHLANMAEEDGGYTGTIQDFCVDFLNGTVLYGKWEDHMEAWLGNHGDSKDKESTMKILWLHYEDMKEDLRQEATRLARFLDVKEARVDEVVSVALSHCTFEAMKKERWRYTPQSVSWKVDPKTGQEYDNFVRQGRVGDGKDFMRNFFTTDLKEQWSGNSTRAVKRWKMARVEESMIERYLKSY